MAALKIKKPWNGIDGQRVVGDNGEVWLVTEVIEKAKNLPVKEIPIDHMYTDVNIGNMSVREFVGHMKLILEADMSYPVILDENGKFFDGRHRLARALLEEMEIIKAVRFEEDPPPTYEKVDK